MLTAKITKTAVDLHADKTYLIGVAEYYDEALNFRVAFNQEDLDEHDEFIDRLRDKIAEEFGIHTYQVEIDRFKILDKMVFWQHLFNSMEIH